MAALQFHHINPEQKDFSITSASARSWEYIRKELDKCVLLCSNCHAEVHDGMVDLTNHLTPEEISLAARTCSDQETSILEFFQMPIPE